jgi:hypothetical protein
MGKYFAFFESVIINPQRSFKLLTGVLHVVIQAILCYEKNLIQFVLPMVHKTLLDPTQCPPPKTEKIKIKIMRERENIYKQKNAKKY